MAKTYSLKKARLIMKMGYKWYTSSGKRLPPADLKLFESHLQILDQALLDRDHGTASRYAGLVEEFCALHFKKTPLTHIREFVTALSFALIVAIVIRQMWFELYEIPTGSMRPTYQERDYLTVSMTQFGLNIPMQPKHLYFNPDLVKRGNVAIFLGDNLPIDDGVSYYFNVIPYSKRFVKRLIAKPGDTLYFYGGKIYGVDSEGQPITELLESSTMQPLEHIPFLSFDGKSSYSDNKIFIRQMNIPVGRISINSFEVKGEVYNGKKWVADVPNKRHHDEVQSYSDLWGMGNFAMTRLLTKADLKRHPELNTKGLDEGVLYLELAHTPSLTYGSLALDTMPYIIFNPQKTLLPLHMRHLDRIMDHLVTTRFVVENGKARPYNRSDRGPSSWDASLDGVPNGTYQFDRGIAQQVGLGGILYTLPADHPLYNRDPKRIQALYNLGIEFNTHFEPKATNRNLFPNRYAYFRDGNLMLMNAPIMTRDDATLATFIDDEAMREATGDYIAFRDSGAPIHADGSWDIQRIKTFGLTVPDKHYLMLGDNHPISADSRVMGFIPEANLRGAPDVLLFPPGPRWFHPEETSYPLINGPRLFVWFLTALITLCYWIRRIRQSRRPIYHRHPSRHIPKGEWDMS